MTAADRLLALDTLDAAVLCDRAETALARLVEVMNEETNLLRAGRLREAGVLGAEKTQLSQDYVTLARALQRAAPRLRQEAPDRLDALRRGHERLATQMAENLRVLATARAVTEDLLSDVALAVGRSETPRTYSPRGEAPQSAARPVSGIAVNRTL